MEGDRFDLTRLRRLQHEAEELAGRLSAAAAAAACEVTGADRDGAVVVTRGVSGAPVGVRLHGDWRRIVGVAGLGAAVVEALGSAGEARLAAWASAAPADPPPPVPIPAELGDPASPQSLAALRDVFELIGAVTARLPEMAAAAEAAAGRTVTATNPTGTVRVTATGGNVTSVELDREWLRAAETSRVADGIRDALRAASAPASEPGPELDRVRRLTASPEALLREIGLLR